MPMQTKLCPKCGRVSPEDASTCECGYSFSREEHSENEDRRRALAQWLGVGSLNVTAFAIAAGLFWGIGLFVLTWWIILFDGSTGDSTLIGTIYRGYTVSPLGSIIGMGWGLVDGFVSGAILAWLYNTIVRLVNRPR